MSYAIRDARKAQKVSLLLQGGEAPNFSPWHINFFYFTGLSDSRYECIKIAALQTMKMVVKEGELVATDPPNRSRIHNSQ